MKGTSYTNARRTQRRDAREQRVHTGVPSARLNYNFPFGRGDPASNTTVTASTRFIARRNGDDRSQRRYPSHPELLHPQNPQPRSWNLPASQAPILLVASSRLRVTADNHLAGMSQYPRYQKTPSQINKFRTMTFHTSSPNNPKVLPVCHTKYLRLQGTNLTGE